MSKLPRHPPPHRQSSPPLPHTEDVDLRLQRQLQLNQQAQLELSQAQTQLSYCTNFLQVVRGDHEAMKKSCLLARANQFGGWEAKIKQFTVAAISHKNQQNEATMPKQPTNCLKKGNCSQGRHLEEVLERTVIERQQREIAQLEQKLHLLYDKISTTLNEELLSDKILGRIKREARRAAKSKLLPLIDRQIGKYKSWQAQSSSQLDSEMQARQIEEKIMQNLEQMKLIMAKKVAANDYIYEQFGDPNAEVYAMIDRMGKVADCLQQDYDSTNALIRQRYLQIQGERIEPRPATTPPNPLDLASVDHYFQTTQDIIDHFDHAPHQPQLQQQYLRINSQLDIRLSNLRR